MVPLQGKGLFSYREGASIDHHTCSRRIGDYRIILIISGNAERGRPRKTYPDLIGEVILKGCGCAVLVTGVLV